MSKRIYKITNLAFEQAELSQCKNKHGAIITKGSKIICKGFNNPRTKFLNMINCCSHAEMDVMRKFINSYYIPKYGKINVLNRNNKTNLGSYILWVIRISNPRSNNLESTLTMSQPCKECTKLLKNIGFKKIGYSDSNGDIVIKKISELDTDHISDAQKYTKNMRIKI